jgi:hypothetical protein
LRAVLGVRKSAGEGVGGRHVYYRTKPVITDRSLPYQD